MKVPLSWLREYVDITMSPEELAHMLTMAGLEVDAIDYIGAAWGDKIITAQITHLEKVADSDHLSYTRVDTGHGELGVVCGAPNIQRGDKVPLAMVGAQVGDLLIGEKKAMGYLSQGMLCSPRELGIGNDHAGIYILDPATEIGQKLVDVLGEVVLDFSIKAHRGDLSSIIGIAREVAALTGQKVRIPQPVLLEQGELTSEKVRVTIEEPDLCPRYTARMISNVTIGPSPFWMGRRLFAAGMRPISNIVDITNYVMLEFGQPLHSFDYALVRQRHIIVRRAHEGETMTTLDNVQRKLRPDMLLISDPEGPTAIAGVMGGAISEVSDHTTTVLLEAANFSPAVVRRTSVTLGLRTDASGRFEKGLDPELVMIANNRAAQLIAELAGATLHPGMIDVYAKPVQPHTIAFSTSEVEWLTGMHVAQSAAVKALQALEFAVQLQGREGDMQVTVPTFRTDIKEGADLVEEVLRIIGYDTLPATIPTGPLPEPSGTSWFDREQEVRNLLIGSHLNEVITYAMTSRTRMASLLTQADQSTVLLLSSAVSGVASSRAESAVATATQGATSTAFDARAMPAIVLTNPLSSDLEVMRLTLMSGLMETVQSNSKRNRAGLRFFEIGRRYLPTSEHSLPDERRTVGIALCGPAEISWISELARPADFYDLTGIVETLLRGLKVLHYRFTPAQHPTFHPGRCAHLEVLSPSSDASAVWHPVGVLGEVHPLIQQRYDLPHRAYLAELDLETLYMATPHVLTYVAISRHQELSRDLAVIVDQKVAAQEVQAEITRNGGDLLRSVTLFDVYTGEPIPAGKKNLTYSLIYQAQGRTLTDAEATTLQDRIVLALQKEFAATLRA